MRAARALALVIAALGAASCTRVELRAVTGDASAPGSGGTNGSGGTIGSGGTSGSGGTTGSGGTIGSGGAGGGATVPCPSTILAAGDTNHTVSVGGSTRSYVLHVPAAYDGKRRAPLIVDYHPLGVGVSGARERAISPYPDVTDPEGVVMAFPTGLMGPSGNAWNIGPCCVANTDDVAFTVALVADVKALACIDASRVYAVGTSMGGGMAYYAACHAADVFAGIAPAAFDLLAENVNECQPTHPVTVVSFRGIGDTLVDYDGGRSTVVPGMPVTFLGAKATFQKWAALDNCPGAPSAEDANGCATYSGCAEGNEVTLCSKQGGNQEAGDATFAWPILKRHTR